MWLLTKTVTRSATFCALLLKLHGRNGAHRISCFNGFKCCAHAGWRRSPGGNRWEDRGKPGGLRPSDQSGSLSQRSSGPLENTYHRPVDNSAPHVQGSVSIQRWNGSRYWRIRGRPRLIVARQSAAHSQTPANEQSEPQAKQQARLLQHKTTGWVRVTIFCSIINTQTFCFQAMRGSRSRNLSDLFYSSKHESLWFTVLRLWPTFAEFFFQ